MIKVNVSNFRSVIGKMNMAIEKSKINPKSGWIELEAVASDRLVIKVGNFDYYMESFVIVDCGDYPNETLHATVVSDTFIPLVSKLSDGDITLSERGNALILSTASSEYTFPIIKELGKVKTIDEIKFNPANCTYFDMDSSDVVSIASTNAKGLIDSVFSKEIQQFIYVDNRGAITFTENIYINEFVGDEEVEYKFLLNGTQAKLLNIFGGYDTVGVQVEYQEDYETAFKVKFTAKTDTEEISLVFITQPHKMVDKFPESKLRALADRVSETHAIIDKKEFDKALARLMVFDKKFDITVMNYSKLVFGVDSVKLVSIKNKNYEIIPYISHENTSEHESIIRFADLQNQLKAVQTNTIDVSYGDSSAIVINSDTLKQLIPEIVSVDKV